ncbi:MAG: N-acetylmuramoyl-L-alanine amidase [Candidatus Omnitrophica bacterium]|nr:N-acetylmuramoyl-L-alanine amidase [Candidatus Omnitrophota bacterium]
MKRAFLLVFLIFLTACATAPHRNFPGHYVASNYTTISDLCKKYGFQYDFDTLDDIVSVSSPGKEIRMLLNSSVVYINGDFFSLKGYPFYLKGSIYVPKEIERLISSKEIMKFEPSLNLKTIVIDAGHGGRDPGAMSRHGLKEKGLNLNVAKRLKEALEEKGYKVILTRPDDEYLTLQRRVEIAKEYNADLFVSIHTNASRSRKLNGVEIYYLSPSRFNSEERAVELARNEGFWKDDLPFDARTILWDMLLIKNYAVSIDLSQSLYFSFKNLGFRVKSPKKAPFYVLRLAYVPSVLVEMGYISNSYEEKVLQRTSYQKQIAEAIALGVASLNKNTNYFTQKNNK